jgi:hypothetical protein
MSMGLLVSSIDLTGYIGYYIDAYWKGVGPKDVTHTQSNLDWIVARRGFAWDLSIWDDETPVDDPDQACCVAATTRPALLSHRLASVHASNCSHGHAQDLGADRATMMRILQAAADRSGGEAVRISGFTPWAYKFVRLLRVCMWCWACVLIGSALSGRFFGSWLTCFCQIHRPVRREPRRGSNGMGDGAFDLSVQWSGLFLSLTRWHRVRISSFAFVLLLSLTLVLDWDLPKPMVHVSRCVLALSLPLGRRRHAL